MGVCPEGELREKRGQAQTQLADLVLHPRGDAGVVGANHQAVALELLQPLREDLRRDLLDAPLELDELLPAELVQGPLDRGGPPAEDDVDDRGDRARLYSHGKVTFL